MNFSARQLQKGMKWWPPFLGAGIRVKSLQDDFRDAVAHFGKHPVTVSMTKQESGGFSHL